MDTYTSIDMHGAHKVGYKVLEYFELWHYPRGSDKFFKEFMLNIVHRKIECSGFPLPVFLLKRNKNTLINYL